MCEGDGGKHERDFCDGDERGALCKLRRGHTGDHRIQCDHVIELSAISGVGNCQLLINHDGDHQLHGNVARVGAAWTIQKRGWPR